MDKVFNKAKLTTMVLLLALIAVVTLIMEHMELPSWPVFLMMIAFFAVEQNVKMIPNILIGGAFGTLNLIILGKIWMPATVASLGAGTASLVYVLIFVGLIVLLGDVGDILPKIFNTYAFLYFLASSMGAAMAKPAPNLVLWIILELVGGAIIVAGCVGIGKIIAALFGGEAHNQVE